MIEGLVGVEKCLSLVGEVLANEGFNIIELDTTNVDAVDAIVISGIDDVMNTIGDTLINVPVINAAGKTPEDIIDELNNIDL